MNKQRILCIFLLGMTVCSFTGCGSGSSRGMALLAGAKCSPQHQAAGEWEWVSGANTGNQPGVYGSRGVAAAGNAPGGREAAVGWTDRRGDLWLFGGMGYDSTSAWGNLNDLWKYSQGTWTWMSGSNLIKQPGSYGTPGIGGSDNTPGTRSYAASWTDQFGNFWLFGGMGMDSTGAWGDLNDLWRYSEGNWVWVGGSNLIEQAGTYGSQGVANPTNVPGARYQAATWTDEFGNFWLFGGLGIDSTGTRGRLRDLWVYSAGEWTWMNGASTVEDYQPGVYGTLGVAAPGNVPGARVDASSWTDSYGNLWLFGGMGYDSTGALGILNDLWVYSAGQWMWMGGPDIVNQFGIYGTQGWPAATNVPGARVNAAAWTDSDGSLWLFGGEGQDANGIRCSETGGPCELNDLWKYSFGDWTWVDGANVTGQPGVYGTQGTAAPGDVPGGRQTAVTWTDAAGNVWMFGGFGFDSTGAPTYLNDLWEYKRAE